MAMKRTLAEKLLSISKMSAQAVTKCRISRPAVSTLASKTKAKAIEPEPGDSRDGIFRRFIHKRPMLPPEMRNPPGGKGTLIEKLREMDIVKDRIRLDGLRSPSAGAEMTTEQARKLLKAAQLEMVISRLRQAGKSWISYPEFVRICREGCSDPDQGSELAKSLDQSGNVIVLGKMVLLRPDQQVAKALGELIPSSVNPNDPRRRELEELERQKTEIDREADSSVRRELWAGLGYLVVQTAAFMRLTFWELSWDVMEPICFYVTSMYFMAGYAFFLRTSKEPSFEGFYQSRFSAKQRQLMKSRGFDVGRYLELRRILYPPRSPRDFLGAYFEQSQKMQISFSENQK